MDEFTAYIEANRERFLDELKQFCGQPSIAAQRIGMDDMANLVSARLTRLGARVKMNPLKDGPPVITAEIGDGPRTLLVYDHYDVQPADPLDQWESGPFEPQTRDGKFYARGVADDKGNLIGRIQAVEAYLATCGKLPLKIKWVLEGEEEVGSPHLASFAAENSALLAADGCLWEGGGKDEKERTGISLGVKGIVYVELRIRCANIDIHSSLATIVPDPAWRLVWALSTLKDEEDHITIDGFMDLVAAPTVEEMKMLAAIPFDEGQMKARFGITAFVRNLTGIEALKKHLFEPTCTICGLKAGYLDQGLKTVLPGTAMAKLDFRLVPDIGPEVVVGLLRRHLDKRGFQDVEIVPIAAEHSAKTPTEASLVKAASSASKIVYGNDPVVYPLSAGGGPMYPVTQALGTPSVSAGGVGYSGSSVHAPNENIRLKDYFDSIKFVCELIRQFGSSE